MKDENKYKNLRVPVKLVFCTDTLSTFDFKHNVKWYIVDYELKEKLSIPDNFEIIACQAAAEGKKLETVLRYSTGFLSWSARDSIKYEIKKFVSENEGLAKSWLFYEPRSLAIKLFDLYKNRDADDSIACVGTVEEIKSL